MMKNSILIIMAGGKSSRMKRDKALLPFGGYNSLSEYQYERFKPFFSKIYISAKENKFDFPVDIIEDCYENSSPLVALISIFEKLDSDEIFLLSVDSPFVDIELFKKLKKRADNSSSAVVAYSINGIEPLCGIYRRTILPKAQEMLREDRHRLQTLLDYTTIQKIYFENESLFINLNYPSDYESAIK